MELCVDLLDGAVSQIRTIAGQDLMTSDAITDLERRTANATLGAQSTGPVAVRVGHESNNKRQQIPPTQSSYRRCRGSVTERAPLLTREVFAGK